MEESEEEQRRLVSRFLNFTGGGSFDTALLYLNASNWRLEEALPLFYAGNDDRVAYPLPDKREFSVWYQFGLSRLSSLYQPPSALLFDGSFHMAMDEAKQQGKWLLANVQSSKEFGSHMLNRDTWAHEVVAETIKFHFVFLQVDEGTSEGIKVCNYYYLSSLPDTLVIDPVTGEKKKSWKGYMEPSALLEDLLPFADRGPCEQYKFLLDKSCIIQDTSAPIGSTTDGLANCDMDDGDNKHDNEDKQEQKLQVKEEQEDDETRLSTNFQNYLRLPEEPKESSDMIRKVQIRLPDGHTLQ